MISHATIWIALDRLADNLGTSPSGLARRAGLDPTAFNKSKRLSPEGKPRWPSTESLAKVLTVTGTSMGDFVVLVEQDALEKQQQQQPQSNRQPPNQNAGIPIVPIDLLGRTEPGAQFDTLSLDHVLGGGSQDLLAVELPDARYEPVYRAGDTLVVNPRAPIRRGDRVLATLTDGRGTLIGNFVRRSVQHFTLTDLLGQNAVAIEPTACRLLARIVMTVG